MTIEKQDKESPLGDASKGLPLSTNKKISFKVYGIILVFLMIVIGNLFFVNKGGVSQKPDEAIDNYSLKPINPIAKEQVELSTPNDVSIQTNQDKLRHELEAAKAKDFVERLQAAQSVEGGTVQSSGSTTNHEVTTAHYTPSVAGNIAGAPQDPNTAYLDSTSQARPDRSMAERFTPQPYLIGQGKFIFATLSVAINSDLPGQVSAVVNQDIYGEKGRNVLIPRGSRLVGEYRSMLGSNQSRIFVVWTRVIQPNGISVMIGSEGTDALGQAGMTGDVNYHFLARFGTASLISLIGAGASTVGVNPNDEYNSMAAYRQAVAQTMAQQASSTLGQTANIPPTVHVKQGERVVVFVNKDLDFSKVYR
jgi:type IV secretion system protein VirB10